MYVWCDLETTGVAPDAQILELYMCWNPGSDEQRELELVIQHPTTSLFFEQQAYELHRRSGLLDELPNGIRKQEAATVVREWLQELPGPAKLAGSSVHIDRGWLVHWLGPELFSHKVHDVSTIVEFAERFGVQVTRTPVVHRAKPDTLDAYRRWLDVQRGLEQILELGTKRA